MSAYACWYISMNIYVIGTDFASVDVPQYAQIFAKLMWISPSIHLPNRHLQSIDLNFRSSVEGCWCQEGQRFEKRLVTFGDCATCSNFQSPPITPPGVVPTCSYSHKSEPCLGLFTFDTRFLFQKEKLYNAPSNVTTTPRWSIIILFLLELLQWHVLNPVVCDPLL